MFALSSDFAEIVDDLELLCDRMEDFEGMVPTVERLHNSNGTQLMNKLFMSL